ncbi:MAG: phenylalanine--tRNA ligase subunit alpha [Chitinophagaceae bacterium]|nr:MAG: phenylalanine--tRNA ligase subunit alpha [Chitinophagaceae bacterium]
MEEILKQITFYQSEINAFQPQNAQELESFRIHFLGTKGIVKSLFGEMKNVRTDQKKSFGQVLNDFKKLAEEKYESAKTLLSDLEENKKEFIDLTLPAEPHRLGAHHPVSIVRKQIIHIFSHLGFAVAEGPEIEDDWHNFTALNMPADHPARDMQDTFYVSRNPEWVLRTHTSSVQVRVMEQGKLPIRIICPGRVFRNETISARAHCFFHQVEGLYIDEGVSFADLKQTLYFFVKEMFGENTGIRFRPSFFPFTEPSAEMDTSCLICGGKGCAVCKHTGWVEILGCGMVHPNVLENCHIDSQKYTGFAFGMGIERIAMLKYQIKDLRLFSENDIRFLEQFAGA